MNVILTNHARRRITDMGLTGADIERAVKDAEVITPSNRTRDKYGNRTGGAQDDAMQWRYRNIAVVGKQEDGAVVVITVLERRYDLYQRE